jgi:hypothetical protein
MTIQDEYKYARRFGYDEAHRVWRQHRAERPTVGVADHAYSECPLTRDELIAAMTPTLGAYPAAPWHELVRTARDEYARWWRSLVERALNPSPPRVVAVELEDDDDEDGSDDSDGSDDCASCGGSGGGDYPMVCRSCSGSGRSRSEPSEPDCYGDEDDDGEGRGADWSAWRARER